MPSVEWLVFGIAGPFLFAVTNRYRALLRAAKFPLTAWTLLIALAAAVFWWRERPARRFG